MTSLFVNSQIGVSPVRVRFAPSPTGHLHIGGLRTALFNWLFARHNGGAFLLRVEDTDITRSKKEYRESQLASLAWAGITYDEPLVIQSERVQEHREIAQRLVREGKAYRCYCPPQKEDGDTDQGYYRYDGRCRNLSFEEQDLSQAHSIRFKIPDGQQAITFHDLVRGEITFERDQLDDFIIVRSDGSPMYNFVVVIDDAFMQISHVIRGEEHISNTPKQIVLYQACGYTMPQFAHLPMILGPDGTKLSKRNAATSVLEYKHSGYLPHALCNYLARLGWAHGDQEIFTREELVNYFSLEHVGKKGAIFDPQKLDWINSIYIKELSDQELLDVMINDVQCHVAKHYAQWSRQQLLSAIAVYKARVKTVAELTAVLKNLHDGPIAYDPTAVSEWINEHTKGHLVRLNGILSVQDNVTHDSLVAVVKGLCKELNIKLVALAQPIRIALTGTNAGPGVFELLALLGKETSIERITKFLATLH